MALKYNAARIQENLNIMPSDLERFIACMNYSQSDRPPNHELGVWAQTRERWKNEAPDAVANFHWNWFGGEDAIGLDHRQFIPINYGFIPPFDSEVIQESDEYIVSRNSKGIVSRSLKQGTVDGMRMSMDQYVSFPVENPDDLPEIRRRLVPALPDRYPDDLEAQIAEWKRRDCPLVLGRNCAANGFYWRARELMGTENLSLAWYDQPDMMHEIMDIFAELVIETSRPVLEKIDVEYFTYNEDFAAKGGPLLGPKTFSEFIAPRMKKVNEFFRSHGVKYIALDSDGDPAALVPQLLDCGIDAIWPMERAAGADPVEYRRRFGKSLRMWGGVDKRILAKGEKALRAHLLELAPLVEEGGFIPTVDHLTPPDVSWDDFRRYMDMKMTLLEGRI